MTGEEKMAGIFKAYDIRGTYPEQLNEEMMEKIGAAAATVLDPGTMVVGHDSSRRFKRSSEKAMKYLFRLLKKESAPKAQLFRPI